MTIELKFRTLLNGNTYGTGGFSYEGQYAPGTILHQGDLKSFTYEDPIVGQLTLSDLSNFDFVYQSTNTTCAFNIVVASPDRTRSLTAGPAQPNLTRPGTSANTAKPQSQIVELEWPTPVNNTTPANPSTSGTSTTPSNGSNGANGSNGSASAINGAGTVTPPGSVHDWPFPVANQEDLAKLLLWLYSQHRRDFRYSYLYQINLQFADLRFCDFSFSYLCAVNFAAANLAACNFGYAYLPYAYLGYAYLGYSYLAYTYLYKANLNYANLNYADLSFAYLVEANLAGANLTAVNLGYADLCHAYLGYANLSHAHLSHAYLRYADLSNADLSHADLSDADLTGANLMGANLTGAKLDRAKLDGAILQGAILPSQDENSTAPVAQPALATV
jgi:uncharacterized protein YjbI with pentapeptide repeats